MFFFFFNDTATTEIYTLSLHDALPISSSGNLIADPVTHQVADLFNVTYETMLLMLLRFFAHTDERSEEHTSELQSQSNLVCRLLLEKKKFSSGATPSSRALPLSTSVWP